jgi:hypothetical protein
MYKKVFKPTSHSRNNSNKSKPNNCSVLSSLNLLQRKELKFAFLKLVLWYPGVMNTNFLYKTALRARGIKLKKVSRS